MAWYNGIMAARVHIDKAGRIVLPKPLRTDLQLAAGDALEVQTSGEQITLRPVRENGPLHKKDGVWVYRAGEPLSAAAVEKTVREVRREREERAGGKAR